MSNELARNNGTYDYFNNQTLLTYQVWTLQDLNLKKLLCGKRLVKKIYPNIPKYYSFFRVGKYLFLNESELLEVNKWF